MQQVVRRAVPLTLVIAFFLWIAIRDFGPFAENEEPEFDGAAAVANLGTGGAIESLSRTIDRQKAERAPAAPGRIVSAPRLVPPAEARSRIRLSPISTRSCRLNPGETVAQFGRAECFRQLGHPDQASAEMQKIEQRTEVLDLSDAVPGLKQAFARSAAFYDSFETPRAAWLLLGIAWVVLTLINVAAGRANGLRRPARSSACCGSRRLSDCCNRCRWPYGPRSRLSRESQTRAFGSRRSPRRSA